MKAKPKVLSRNDLDVEAVAALRPGPDRGHLRRADQAPVRDAGEDRTDRGAARRLRQARRAVAGAAADDRQGARPRGRGQLRDDLEARFEKARAENPEFAGKSGLVPYAFEPGTFQGLRQRRPALALHPRARLQDPVEEIDQLAGKEFYVEFSKEQFRLMDQDAVLL